MTHPTRTPESYAEAAQRELDRLPGDYVTATPTPVALAALLETITLALLAIDGRLAALAELIAEKV